jgi:hypothetical protein
MVRCPRLVPAWAVVLATLALAACTSSNTPVSPSTQAAVTGQTAESGQTIGVTGVVQRLSVPDRTFLVAWRGGSRIVTADADTVIWSQRSNSRVRFGALAIGQNVAVRGIDQGRSVLARSIVINR